MEGGGELHVGCMCGVCGTWVCVGCETKVVVGWGWGWDSVCGVGLR